MDIIDQKNIKLVDTKSNIKKVEVRGLALDIASDVKFEECVADRLEKLAIRVKKHLTMSELIVVGTALACLRRSGIETE